MLDITLLRKDLAGAVARLETRKSPQAFLDVKAFTRLEAERKTIQMRTEALQSQRNTLSKQIGQLKSRGPAGQAEADVAMAAVAGIKDELEASAKRLDELQAELQSLLLAVPNLPHESVPVGADEHGNVLARSWGTPKAFDFPIKDHVDLGEPLGLDFGLGVKLSGARFTAPWRSSCWMCKPRSTATPSATRLTSSMPTPCTAPASCPNLKGTCLPPRRVGKTAKPAKPLPYT